MGDYIVKIVHSSHRRREAIEAEVEWIVDLEKRGLPVPKVVPSIHGQLVETISSSGGYYSVVCYEKLLGEELWNDNLFRQWGSLIGKLHSASSNFVPTIPRSHWYESDFLNVGAYIPTEFGGIRTNAERVIKEIKELPQNVFKYGLIHADVYQDNFIWREGVVQLFDFDNCEYGYLVSDLAIALYAALWRLPQEGNAFTFSKRFLRTLLDGYLEENFLSPTELDALPLFLRLREILIYTVGRKKLDLKNLTQVQSRLLSERGERIRRGQPIVDVLPILASLSV